MNKRRITLRGGNKEFFEFTGREAILGGPAETGKTFAGLLKIHTLLTKYRGAQISLIRKVGADLKGTVLLTYRRDILGLNSFKEPHPYVKVRGGDSPEWFDYKPTGARLWVGGLDNPGKTLSGERDVIFFPQAEQATSQDWEYLIRSTTGRGSAMPYTQLLGDCNPGPPTHWILNRPSLKLFHSRHRDNPMLFDDDGNLTAQGVRSMADLQTLTGAQYKRLYQGLWSSPEGAIYDIYDDERHKVKAFVPNRLWPRFVGIDPVGARVAALWVAYDPDNQVLNVYREYCEPFGITTPGHADNILKLSSGETIFAFAGGGPSERQARTDFAGAGIDLLEPPNIGVWAGVNRVYQLLREFAIVVHDSCPQLVSEIGSYQRKMVNDEVTDTIVDKDKFHLLDALRYACAWILRGRQQIEVSRITKRIGR